MSWRDEDAVKARRDEEGRTMWGKPEFADALSYIGRQLGLTGSYHLVTDVLDAFDRFLDTRPEEMPRLLARLQYALEHTSEAQRRFRNMAQELQKLEEDWKKDRSRA